MQFDIITIFPRLLDSYLAETVIGRAIKNKLISIKTHDLRDYTHDAHKTVDDKPYGGGVGMVMKVEPWFEALAAIPRTDNAAVVMVTPRGKQFDQQMAKKLYKKHDQLIFVCGRYEGIDERVRKLVDYEVSIGPYVLAGGELPALVMAEAIARLVPGVLGKDESAHEESHDTPGYIEYPHYTRPEIFNGWRVPKVLLGGDHKAIREWREKHAKGK